MKTVKDYGRIQGVGRERITIECHPHLLWILTRRFKIWGMIFFYIMRQRWCCLYQLPQTTWLGMCQCILKFGSWIVQRVMQMHGFQFGYVQVSYLHFVTCNLVYCSLYTFFSGTNWQKKELFVMAVCSASGDNLPGNLTIIPSAQKWVFHAIYQHVFPYMYSSEVVPEIDLSLQMRTLPNSNHLKVLFPPQTFSIYQKWWFVHSMEFGWHLRKPYFPITESPNMHQSMVR